MEFIGSLKHLPLSEVTGNGTHTDAQKNALEMAKRNPPIVVRRTGSDTYNVVTSTGEAILSAATALNWERVWCTVLPDNVTDEEVAALAMF